MMSTLKINLNATVESRKQRGAALIISLLFLVMLTLLGVGAMTSTTLEEKMAGNARDYGVALQAGEAALRDAWEDLISGRIVKETGFNAACTDGLCTSPTTTSTPLWLSLNWSAAGPSLAYGSKTAAPPLPTGVGGVAEQPRYIIEAFKNKKALESASDPQFIYRVTVRAVGGTTAASTILQSTYKGP